MGTTIDFGSILHSPQACHQAGDAIVRCLPFSDIDLALLEKRYRVQVSAARSLALKSHVGRISGKDLAPIGAAFAEELDTILALAGKSVGPYRVEV